MNANGRLLELQSRLKDCGVLDVKFCFTRGLDSQPKSDAIEGVCDFLDAYLGKRYEVVKSVAEAEK